MFINVYTSGKETFYSNQLETRDDAVSHAELIDGTGWNYQHTIVPTNPPSMLKSDKINILNKRAPVSKRSAPKTKKVQVRKKK